VTRFLPARVEGYIDEHRNSIQVVIGFLALSCAFAIFVLGLAVKANGDETGKVVADSQVSRFVNTLAACEKDNAQNADHNDLWLLNIALAKVQPPEEALEVFAESLRVFYPNEPDCAYVAFYKVCVDAVLTSNPRCRQYVKEHDVAGKKRAFEERQADNARRRKELFDRLSPAQRAILNRA
jgi:hypothetical protein